MKALGSLFILILITSGLYEYNKPNPVKASPKNASTVQQTHTFNQVVCGSLCVYCPGLFMAVAPSNPLLISTPFNQGAATVQQNRQAEFSYSPNDHTPQ
ncbi:MAG: hypothetical protein R2792_01525 [Saprospiraceae bacterium]|jgi:hypothetical protein